MWQAGNKAEQIFKVFLDSRLCCGMWFIGMLGCLSVFQQRLLSQKCQFIAGVTQDW